MTSLLVSLLLLGQTPQPQQGPARATEQMFNHDGVNLHTVDWGGTGDVMLFLPSFGDSCAIFDDIAVGFNTHFHVVGLTRRGQAKSDRAGTYSVDAYVADDEAYLASIQAKKVVLVGHALAGPEIIALAKRQPKLVSALVLLDAGYDFSAEPFASVIKDGYRPAPPQALRNLTTYRNYSYAGGQIPQAPAMDLNLRHKVFQDADGVHEAMDSSTGSKVLSSFSFKTDLTGIPVPVLAFYRKFSVPPGLTKEQLANFKREVKPWQDWQKSAVSTIKRNGKSVKVIEYDFVSPYLFFDKAGEVGIEMSNFLTAR